MSIQLQNLLTAKQVAKKIGMSRTAIYDWIAEGPPKGLKHVMVGRQKMVMPEWFEESERAMDWMERKVVKNKEVNANEENLQCDGDGGD